ncbi:cipC-like antibiotic response protein [Sporothrix brasiliensis 5110]|uniref:CipC-like antibiotic response protein n=1 Tax=Sporothrix brasiliensis 5110 TaxID=1398154 RepID=A0A0C2FP46_9PEZI|nr:cipC-like antibiotic response protein [Sporothrix brasiliensis 5110]KIH92823.1 cipC-like antibiotic response protein [Sporothrix brasiliensis 5110]
MGFFGFDESRDARDQVYNNDNHHEGSLSHELLGAGASFAAMHEWEKHQRAEGQTVSHGFAKEAIAAFAGAEVDKLVETKGLDFIDREKAKHHARQNAEQLYDQQYGNQDNFDP